VARALGASPLKPETSRNYSAGFVVTPVEHLDLSADFFRIPIHDRIVLGEFLSGPAATAVLTSQGITNASQARFFTNAADTLTQGVELSLHWTKPVADEAVFGLSMGYAHFTNQLTALRANPVVPSLPLLGRTSIDLLTSAQPDSKLTVNTDLSWGRAHFFVDAVEFGPYRVVPLVAEQTFHSVTTFNLSAAYDVTRATRLQLGVINANDKYPDRVIGAIDGRVYQEAGGLGFDGREYFLRATANFQ
jgi:iron complex outermembrane receptor protein